MRSIGAPVRDTYGGRHRGARCLRIRPHSAASGPSRGLAGECGPEGSRTAGRSRDRTLSAHFHHVQMRRAHESENRRLQPHLPQAVFRTAAGGRSSTGARSSAGSTSRSSTTSTCGSGCSRSSAPTIARCCRCRRRRSSRSIPIARSPSIWRAGQRFDGRARARASGSVSGVHRLAPAQPSRRERRGARARRDRARGARRAGVFERQRPSARRRAVLRAVRDGRPSGLPDLAASGARRGVRGLSRRREVEIRDLVDVRMAVRDERGDAAAGVLAPVRSAADRSRSWRIISARWSRISKAGSDTGSTSSAAARRTRTTTVSAASLHKRPTTISRCSGPTRPSSAAGRRPSAG